MYKALFRPHLDYCDIILHITPLNSPSTPGLIHSWKKLKEPNTKPYWLLLDHGKIVVELDSMKSWAGRVYLAAVDLDAFCGSIRLELTLLKEKLPALRKPTYRITNPNTFQEIKCKTSGYKNSYFQTMLVYGIM